MSFPPPPQIPNLMDAGPEEIQKITVVTQDAVNTLGRVLGREHGGLHQVARETGERIEQVSSKVSQTNTHVGEKEKQEKGKELAIPSAPPWNVKQMEETPVAPLKTHARTETKPDGRIKTEHGKTQNETPSSETYTSSNQSQKERTEALLHDLTASVGQLQQQVHAWGPPEQGGGGRRNTDRMDGQRNRIKVARPPVYTGQVGRAGLDPLEDWIYALEMYFRALEITDPQLRAEYACSMLREKAAAWSRTSQRKRMDRGEVPWDWHRLIGEMRRQFGRLNPAKDSRIQLEKLKQRDSSVRSLREYISQFMALAVGLTDASEAELLHRFTGGLHPEPCYELIRANVETIEEATRVMENYAMALDATHIQTGGRAFRSMRGTPARGGNREGYPRNKNNTEPWKAYQLQPTKGSRIQFPITVKSMGHFLAIVEKGLERNWIREKIKAKVTEIEEGSPSQAPMPPTAAVQDTMLSKEDAWGEEGDWIELPADETGMKGVNFEAAVADWEVHSFQSSEEDLADLIDLMMVKVEEEEEEIGMSIGNGRNPLMTIMCKIGAGVETEALLDTGASVNIMGRSLFQRLEPQGAVLSKRDKKTLRGIGGITVGVEGSTNLSISIGKMSAVLPFLVVHKEPHLILGKSGMGKLQMLLDPATDTIINKQTWESLVCGEAPIKTINSVAVQAPSKKKFDKTWQVKLGQGAFPPMQKNMGKYEIRLPQDIWLPPKKTVQVMTGVYYRFPVGLVGRVEGKHSLVSQQLAVTAVNLDQQGEVKFGLCNFGERVCQLHRGQRCVVVVLQRGMTPPLVVQRMEEKEEGTSPVPLMAKTIQVLTEGMIALPSHETQEVTISLLQPIDKKFWPRQEPQGIVIPLGRSLVLGLGEGKKVLMPYRMETPPDGVRDCLNLRVRAWTKWLPNGMLWILLQNLATEPIQLTPSMRVLWLPGAKLKLLGVEGECLLKEGRVPRPVMEVQPISLVTVQELEKEFPRCFNGDFQLTAKMKKVTIGLDDVLWKKERVWHSSAYTQPISAIQEQVVEQELKDLESKGIIEKVPVETKLFLSQLLVIPKGTGACRITLDLRRLNTMCVAWSSPLPGRRALLSKVPNEWRYFSKIDLAHGFYNIPISSELSRMFSFIFKQEKFVLKRLAMGWLNSPAIFHSLVSGSLADLPVIVYLDDLLVGGKDVSSHNLAVRQVMCRLQQWGFKVKPAKMEIGRPKVEFLGYLVERGRFTVQPAVLQTLRQLPAISSLKTFRQALGVLNLLQDVIPNYSSEVGHLYEVLKKGGAARDWVKIQESFSNTMRRCVERVFCLTSVDPGSDQFHLFCDWSSHGIGFVLWQMDSKGQKRLLQLGSRRNPIWRRATSSLLGELYALVWSLKSTNWVTRGSQRIVIHTDSQNIMLKLKDPRKLVRETDIRCMRLIGFLLSNYSLGSGLQLKFVATNDNSIADLLSRWAFTEKEDPSPWSPEVLEQEENQWGTRPVLDQLTQEKAACEVGVSLAVTERNWSVLHGGHFGLKTVLYRSKRLGIPISIREAAERIAKCPVCQSFQGLRRDTKLAPLVHVKQPNQGLGLDYIGPVNHKYVLVIKDLFSKELLLLVTPTCSYEEGIKAVELWKNNHPGGGYPSVLQLDKAGGFNAHAFRTWTDQHNIKVCYAHAYDHRSHGAVERANQMVIKTVGKLSLETGLPWWSCVASAQKWINYSYHRAIGMAPHDCLTGGEVAWRKARAQSELLRIEMNKGRRELPIQYAAGELVWVYQLAQKRRGRLGKFSPPWDGPLTVVDKQSLSSYRVRNRNGRVFQIHADFLRPYCS